MLIYWVTSCYSGQSKTGLQWGNTLNASAPTIRKDPTIIPECAWKVFVVLGVFIESVFSDHLLLSLCLALAKPNNCFRPPALNEGCGKNIFLKILARSLCLDQFYDPLYSWNLTGEFAVSLCSTPWVFVARTLIYASNKCWCSTKDLAVQAVVSTCVC